MEKKLIVNEAITYVLTGNTLCFLIKLFTFLIVYPGKIIMKIEDDTFQTILSRNFANIRKLKLIPVEYNMSAMMRLGSLLLEIIIENDDRMAKGYVRI